MSAYGGYLRGQNDRYLAQDATVSAQIKIQYDQGVKDLQAKNYDLARQRFEWVLQNDPSYPGAQDGLVQAMLALQITATFTPAPTPTLTPTPDTRSVDEMYTQAQQYMAGGDWNNAIETLLNLRKADKNLHAVEVDDMFYVALRNRGVDKIKKADLEGGTYDLAQAERFGPLDVEASNWREWAEWYTTGASYWELDWSKAVYYFQQLSLIAPYLMDGSKWSAIDRYHYALVKYGDQLMASGEYCKAQDQYKAALEANPPPTIEATATYAADKCNQATNPVQESTPVPGGPAPAESTPVPADTATTQPEQPTEAAPTAYP